MNQKLFLTVSRCAAAAAAVLISSALPVKAATLGDPALPLTIERWVKGAPVKVGPGTNLFVVEFWATWCGPCKQSIPHLTELQRKHAGQGVIIVGVSSEPLNDVAPFVAGQGDGMAYRVAIDSSEGSQHRWFAAFGEKGIPHAFVVGTNGTILWHGFPNSALDDALDEILSGKFDLAAERNFDIGNRLIAEYTALVSQPNAGAKAAPVGERILSDYSKDWRLPYRLARAILTDEHVRARDLALGLRAANKAVEMTESRSYQALEMQARAWYATGKKAEAVEIQKKAIAQCNDSEDMPELKKFLDLFEKGASH